MLLNIFQAGSFLESPPKIPFSADRYSSDIYPMNTATNRYEFYRTASLKKLVLNISAAASGSHPFSIRTVELYHNFPFCAVLLIRDIFLAEFPALETCSV